MRLRSFVVLTLLLATLVSPGDVLGQAYEPWLGTWVLNLSKSTYEPGPVPYRRGSFTVEPWEDGVRIVYDLVRQRGGITHLEWSGRFDGNDYPVQGLEQVITYAYRRVNGHTYDAVMKADGTSVATSRVVLSTDGQSMTSVTVGTSPDGQRMTTTTVYERR
jgi:hypothetical protein